MAAKDAEMPAHHALREEVETIASHLATLRKDIEDLAGSVMRAGSHQAGRLHDAADETMNGFETDIRRNPTKAVGIAFGLGVLVGLILRH